MALTQENMQHLCTLGKISPSQEKRDLYGKQCDKIISYMDQLAEVDITNVEPLYSPVLQASVYREDIVHQKLTKEEVLSNAPQTDGDYFIVPKIVG